MRGSLKRFINTLPLPFICTFSLYLFACLNCLFKCSNTFFIYFFCFFTLFTVPPGQPRISPTDPIAKEGTPFELKCFSEGGSPDPEIKWTKDELPLDDVLVKGGRRNKPTSATLTIVPQMTDDKSVYKCTVWNRAMNENEKFEKSIAVDVHCKLK